jgi:tRNA(adenine34) deaminase
VNFRASIISFSSDVEQKINCIGRLHKERIIIANRHFDEPHARGRRMDCQNAEFWMREALAEARKAESQGEVPIGAVLLVNEKIVARGHKRSILTHDPTAHAEIVALRHGTQVFRNYRMPGSVLVVTIEPCVMCVGAMIQARVEHVIYGAADPKAGAIDSHFQLADSPTLNHKITVLSGILEQECRSLLTTFFQSRR